MQFTTINKLISQLLVGVLAFAVAGWLAYSYELKFAQPLGGLPASLAWSGEKGGGLTVAVSGLIALAAIASLGLVLEGLSLLYLQPLLRGVPGQKEDRVLRFFPRKEFFDNLMFWQEEFGKCVGQNNKFAQLPASIAGDPDKQRGLAVVAILTRVQQRVK